MAHVPEPAPTPNHAVDIRLVQTDAEFAACEAMSRDIWGAAERNVVPRELLKTMQLNGGVVAGAFLPDSTLVGFVFGFAGLRDGKLRLCSHQLGVQPAYRGRGLGIALKEAQAQQALALGYDLMTWTFDPLEARNAYLNLHRLGAIARRYDRNHYGDMDDELNRGLPSDRFEAEWWLHQRGSTRRANLKDAVPVLRVAPGDEPERLAVVPQDGRPVLIGIPRDFQALKRRSMDHARRWRLESRAVFEAALAAGLSATDFLLEGAYVMEADRLFERPPAV
jgi:predicted GNAT superfamily acetyltransferase